MGPSRISTVLHDWQNLPSTYIPQLCLDSIPLGKLLSHLAQANYSLSCTLNEEGTTKDGRTSDFPFLFIDIKSPKCTHDGSISWGRGSGRAKRMSLDLQIAREMESGLHCDYCHLTLPSCSIAPASPSALLSFVSSRRNARGTEFVPAVGWSPL